MTAGLYVIDDATSKTIFVHGYAFHNAACHTHYFTGHNEEEGTAVFSSFHLTGSADDIGSGETSVKQRECGFKPHLSIADFGICGAAKTKAGNIEVTKNCAESCTQ